MIEAVFLNTQDAAAVETWPAVASVLSSSTRLEK